MNDDQRRLPEPSPLAQPGERRSPLPRWTVPVAAMVVLVVAGGTLLVLWRWIDGLALVNPADKDRVSAQLAAIKTASGIAVGGGGLFALYLAARRQRTQELELEQRERAQVHIEQVAEINRRHAERVAEASESDAAARRVTELYTAAVEQLGSDKAPVRLGGLYALERLAQDNPDLSALRQTVVNVLCAYLRMPWAPPGVVPPEEADEPLHALYERRAQEREVRLTAQRILRDHLRSGGDQKQPVATFWGKVTLDLTGATLVDLDLSGCRLHHPGFAGASFTGDTSFEGAQFELDAQFEAASFAGEATFADAWFAGDAQFTGTRFAGDTGFERAAFRGDVWFDQASFARNAWFNKASFLPGCGVVMFGRASFTGNVRLSQAQFNGNVMFGAASFAGDAWFDQTSFNGVTRFDGSSFAGKADFGGASFKGETRFDAIKDAGKDAGWAGFDNAWSFVAARFEAATSARAARFDGEASFSWTSFDGEARFDGASFAGEADFTTAMFCRQAGFHGTSFTGSVFFRALAANPLSPYSTWPTGWQPTDHHRPVGNLDGDWHDLVQVEPDTARDA